MCQYLTTTKRRIRHRFRIRHAKSALSTHTIEVLPPIGETLTVSVSPSERIFQQTYLKVAKLTEGRPEHLVFLAQELSGEAFLRRLVIYTAHIKKTDFTEYAPSLTYEVLEGFEAKNLVRWTDSFYSVDIYPLGSRHKRETVYLCFSGPTIKLYNSQAYPADLEVPGAEEFLSIAQTWIGMLQPTQLRLLQGRLQTRLLLAEAAEVLGRAEISTDPMIQHQAALLSSFVEKDPIPEALAQQTLTILRGLL